MSLQYGILGLLNYSPMDGYDLKKLFGKSVNYIWTASLSQIYRELGALEEKGFVSSTIHQQEDRPDKRIYSITEEGKAAFLEWLRHFPDMLAAPTRDEFMLRILFGAKLSRTELVSQFERFIEERKQADAIMAEDKKVMDGAGNGFMRNLAMALGEEDEMYWRMITRRAVMTNRLQMQWAQDCIRELKDAAAADENQEVNNISIEKEPIGN